MANASQFESVVPHDAIDGRSAQACDSGNRGDLAALAHQFENRLLLVGRDLEVDALGPTAPRYTSSTGSSLASADALRSNFVFVLGNAGQYPGMETPSGGIETEPVFEANQVDLPIPELVEQLTQALGRPAQAIEPPDHYPLELAGVDAVHQLPHAGPVHGLAGEFVFVPDDPAVVGLLPPLQIGELTGVILADGADADVDRGVLVGHVVVPFVAGRSRQEYTPFYVRSIYTPHITVKKAIFNSEDVYFFVKIDSLHFIRRSVFVDHIERLRASKARSNAGARQEGLDNGREWAMNHAEAIELEELARARKRAQRTGQSFESLFEGERSSTAYTPGELFVFMITPENDGSRSAAAEFWEGVLGDDVLSPHELMYVVGFAEGALEVWNEVEGQL